MNSWNVLLLLSFVVASLVFVTEPLRAADESDFGAFSPKADDVLHMQITKLTGINSSIEESYYIYLIDTNPAPWLPFIVGHLGPTFFASPPLASAFTFNNITLNICHSVESSAYMEIGIGWWDTEGNAHIILDTTAPLTPHAAWTNTTIDITLSLEQGQRLLIGIRTTTDGTTNIMFYFGDEDHDSTAQYAGTASYVSEFPGSLAWLFAFTTLATILLRKRITGTMHTRIAHFGRN